MTRHAPSPPFILFLAWACLAAPSLPARADEGMWPFHDAPFDEIEKRYGFKPTPEWLERLQLCSVRVAGMGSGSFVSPDGLVMTNHHIVEGCLQKLSTTEKNYLKEGFRAKDRSEETLCPGMEFHVLIRVKEVTKEVLAAVKPGASQAEAEAQRKAATEAVRKKAGLEFAVTGGKPADIEIFTEAVELFQGAQVWLYSYMRFADARLVMAPEVSAGFFGGDGDNFNYPRYAFDMAFLRVYVNGEPYRPKHYLKWSQDGAKENQLVFVSGHPGRTQRIRSLSQLEFDRDYQLTALYDGMRSARAALAGYAALGEKQALEVHDKLFTLDNSIKVYDGMIAGLKDPKVAGKKAAEEKALREAVAKDPKLEAEYGKAWEELSQLKKADAERFKARIFRSLGSTNRFGTSLLADMSSKLVRYTDQERLPDGERFPEFKEGARDALRKALLAPLPFSAELEERLFSASLELAAKALGQDDPFIKEMLAGKTPAEVAKEAVAKTQIADPKFREDLLKGGWQAVESSKDPLVRLARLAEPYYREARQWYEKTIAPAEAALNAKIGRAYLAVRGKEAYPDATFTLRLSYGKVAGYEELTRRVPCKTTFYGLFDRSCSFDNREPFELPPTIAKNKDKADLSTPLDFVTTNDIIGGNSGSPMVNQDGEVVGLVFDGNIYSLAARYHYTDDKARALAVHSSGILEALSKFYDMPALAEELAGKAAQKVSGGPEDDGRRTGK